MYLVLGIVTKFTLPHFTVQRVENWYLVQALILNRDISGLILQGCQSSGHKRLSESIDMQIEELYWKLRLVLLEPE